MADHLEPVSPHKPAPESVPGRTPHECFEHCENWSDEETAMRLDTFCRSGDAQQDRRIAAGIMCDLLRAFGYSETRGVFRKIMAL